MTDRSVCKGGLLQEELLGEDEGGGVGEETGGGAWTS